MKAGESDRMRVEGINVGLSIEKNEIAQQKRTK